MKIVNPQKLFIYYFQQFRCNNGVLSIYCKYFDGIYYTLELPILSKLINYYKLQY